jgi:16S rRNA (guanine(527)-N(7))-methyltransferase GidB
VSSVDDDDVSRETSAREQAETFFGDRLPLAVAYAELLRSDGIGHGLIGPREGDRLWSRHLLNCAVLRDMVEPAHLVADVGSGAGLPGIPLAIAVPGLHVTLIEPLERRAAFLTSAVESLGLGEQLDVVRARAEDLPDLNAGFDVVTARALAPLSGLLGWTVPLTRVGGRVVAMKGAKVREELAAARRELRRYGVQEWHVHSLGQGIVTPPTTVVEFVVGERPQPKTAKPGRRRSGTSAAQRSGGHRS